MHTKMLNQLGYHLVAAALLITATTATPFIKSDVTSFSNLDWVNVTFGGLTLTEAKEAWIGVFSPADVNTSTIPGLPYPATAPWTAAAPVKYIRLSSMKNAAEISGDGSWKFELINMYESVVFKLFKGGVQTPTEVARSEKLIPKDYPPLRGHLARGEDGSSMFCTWNSAVPGASTNHTVKYGTVSGVYTNIVVADTKTYDQQSLCGAPARTHGWFDPHYWHTATLMDLVPGTRYYYIYGSDSTGYSPEYSFRHMEAPNPHAPLNLLVYADMGMAELDGCEDHWADPRAWETTKHMINRASTGNYSFALHVGDVSYATGYQAKWYLFDERVSVLGRQIPIMLGHGNHERDYPGTGTSPVFSKSVDSGGECGVPTVVRYPTPPAPGNPNPLNSTWYSFAQGPLTVIMLNSELAVGPGSPQHAFLADALHRVDRNVTPWLAVAFHRPMYTGPVRDRNFAQCEPLLYAYQVDLVLTGHVHNAQVFCAIYNGTCRKPTSAGAYDAPKHVVIGNAGMNLSPLIPAPDIIEFSVEEFGYSTISIPSATSLTMNLYADATNALLHTFTITRNFPRASIPIEPPMM